MRVTYTSEQKQYAIKTYKRLKSYSKTLQVLGYPSYHVLFDWVNGRDRKHANHVPRAAYRHYTWEFKHEAVMRASKGEDVKSIARDMGIPNSATIYGWLKNFRMQGVVGLMTRKEKPPSGTYKTKAQLKADLPNDVDELKELAARLIVEKAVLEQQLELAKKCPGSIPGKLPPRTKAAIATTLRSAFPLELLLDVLDLKRSSYYYARSASMRPDRYADVRHQIHDISTLSMHTYGSPRIWCSLRKRGTYVSEKVVRRLMREEAIEVHYARRRRKYSSYIGEITPAVEDLVKHNFHAGVPNTLWLTDISEFAASDGKVYLSPLIDCFDGKLVSWATSKHPDSALVEEMLDRAFAELGCTDDRLPGLVIHTDRGGHYRGGEWIERLEGKGIVRSMSRKGNSGDNAACEGFFGRMKTEMYYGRRWESSRELEKAMHEYMAFYNNERVKLSLGGISIHEYRDRELEMSRKVS